MSDDEEFWKEFVGLLIQLVCLVEREKLKREPTTAELRKAGKETLCKKDG